ncbi:P-loop containing nucleoside triphosphate hydrolase protein, partial [Schizophyllum fasciatum]
MVVQTKTGGRYTTSASVDSSIGKGADLKTSLSINEDQVIKTLVSIGKDDPTRAEANRAATVLRILQGGLNLMDDNPWVQNIWLRPEPVWPEEWSVKTPSAQKDNLDRITHLNPSQRRAAKAMLSDLDQHRITIIQGPPGTGKTSVIAATVQQSIAMGKTGLWLVAQSNVAVKNIAEKLEKVGFHDYRLLVSKDFHFEHEHIYDSVKANVIRSDQFKFISRKDLKDVKVILCTISMLSNNFLKKFLPFVPFNTLIIDEASQIEIGAYIPIFTTFTTLRKTCFIGDDKQLPPFGQDNLEDLQSIFEVPHLCDNVIFLDTQYRMPPQLGDFISQAVYNGQLKSNPLHPITSEMVTIKIVDAEGSEQPSGDSFQNKAECREIMKIAAIL